MADGMESTARGTTSNTSTLRSGYGTTGERVLHDLRRHLDAVNAEEAALLPRIRAAKAAPPSRLHRYLNADVSRRRADLILLFSYVITGLLDSSATAIWGSFVSMQTGNTVYLGLGLAGPYESTRWVKSLISIVGFCFGSFCFSRFHASCTSRRRRWVLATSVLLQFLCILAAAVIVTVTPRTEPGNGHDLHWHVLVALAIVSFQSSGQAVISRALQYGSLTSVVLTSIYCDLWSDQNLFAANNVDRNRRVAAPILLLVGALIGGVWSRSEIGMMGALWTAAALKLCIVMTWLVWKSEEDDDMSAE